MYSLEGRLIKNKLSLIFKIAKFRRPQEISVCFLDNDIHIIKNIPLIPKIESYRYEL